MNNILIEINNLSKEFSKNNEKIKVLDNLSFDLYEGEFLAIIGSSGCGKTTLFNIISGLEKDYQGSINYNLDKNEIGYMFQEPALFPWLTIEKNANLTSKIKKVYNQNNIDELLDKYNLKEFKNKYPNEISGGMKQRVSLIRTISSKPKLLLLDEPFAALDYQSRLAISTDIYKLVKENNITTILITHDISEALSLADRIIVLSKRPARVKNTYNINFECENNPISKRKNEKFLEYYEFIGKDLDIFEIQ